MKINTVIKNLFRENEGGALPFNKFDESLTPNLRALRLSMGVGDTLLSMGVAASDVVAMALDVTDTYCKRKVQFEITSTLLMVSQDRGNDREPLTLIRPITPRTVNDRQIQVVQELVRDIDNGSVNLDEAEERFDYIISHPDKYPLWLTTVGSASVSGGVGMLLTASPIIISIMFISGGLIAAMLRVFARQKIPTFFIQVAAAMLITIIAGFVAWLSRSEDIAVLQNVNPNYIVIGGIIMLGAGLTIVGAVQDAIDEFYITANARILRVVMMTIGIVLGVVIGLYFTKKFGVWIDLSQTKFSYNNPWLQYTGAVVIASGFALSNHATIKGIVISGLLGSMSYFIFITLLIGDFSSIAASGIAAAIAGGVGTLISRISRVPSIALTTAGIVPLVPGLTLFNGLMELFADSSAAQLDETGSMLLLNALFIALAIAGGASFGTMVARPVRRTLIRARNALPRRRLHN